MSTLRRKKATVAVLAAIAVVVLASVFVLGGRRPKELRNFDTCGWGCLERVGSGTGWNSLRETSNDRYWQAWNQIQQREVLAGRVRVVNARIPEGAQWQEFYDAMAILAKKAGIRLPDRKSTRLNSRHLS